MAEQVNRQTGAVGWPDLQELSRPFPTDFVERKDNQDYVAHHVVNQRLLSIVGPFDFELVQVIRGDIAARPSDPTARSQRAKAGTPALQQVVVGGIWRLSCVIDGRQVRIEEVGDVGDVHNWLHDGQRLKDAASDALKRCAMRLGLGLHLWAQEHYFLDQQLRAQVRQPSAAEQAGRKAGETAAGRPPSQPNQQAEAIERGRQAQVAAAQQQSRARQPLPTGSKDAPAWAGKDGRQ